MAYLCLKCFKIHEQREIKKLKPTLYKDKIGSYYICPSCKGQVVEIDELMVLIIKELNQKGYKTEYSCSGHSYQEEPNCYILFRVKPPHIPKGFTREGNTIRKIFKGQGTQLFKEINQTAIELLEWANKLPERGISEKESS